MDLLAELRARKVINNITNVDKVNQFFKSKKYGCYIGFDPSFKSLHLGNYLQLVTLKRFMQNGYKVIALIGGATGQIGDPSGKKAERQLLDNKIINQNIVGIENQIKKIVNCEVINNLDFYKNITLFDFLRLVGKSINVNYLLEKEIIAKRLESGISFAEFSYTLIQAYDFLCLYQKHHIALQMGGSDQWGNITTGIELIRKETDDNNLACGITFNLLTKSDGTKFGKSESGAIYLDPELTSPYQLYQFLINQNDDDIEKLLLALTFIPIAEIENIVQQHSQNKNLRYGQKTLAKTIVSDLYGKDTASECERISEIVFSGNLSSLDEKTLLDVLSNIPTIDIAQPSINICDLLVQLKISPSKSNARQLIQSKSIRINDQLVDNFASEISKKDALGNKQKFSYVKKGKRNFYLINWK